MGVASAGEVVGVAVAWEVVLVGIGSAIVGDKTETGTGVGAEIGRGVGVEGTEGGAGGTTSGAVEVGKVFCAPASASALVNVLSGAVVSTATGFSGVGSMVASLGGIEPSACASTMAGKHANPNNIKKTVETCGCVIFIYSLLEFSK